MPHRRGRAGLIHFLFLSTFTGTHADLRLVKLRGTETSKTQSLLSRKVTEAAAYSPFYRSEGVRGGVEQEPIGSLDDSGAEIDSGLDRNIVTGSSMALDFKMLDNLDPVAPMDRVHGAVGKDEPVTGVGNLQPIYVPPYLNPDTFPSQTKAKLCKCTMPSTPNAKIECCCEHAPCPKAGPGPAPAASPAPAPSDQPKWAAPPRQKPDPNSHYVWMKEVPIPGTNQYRLVPADLTYPSGNYWGPETRDGLVAPADALWRKNYPLQSIGDHVFPIPHMAREDRIGMRFARYVDQVEDRSGKSCRGKSCKTECKPGDQVGVSLGNLLLDGEVIKTFAGNAALVKFKPHTEFEKETIDCPAKFACSMQRYCKPDNRKVCTRSVTKHESHNWNGDLHYVLACPSGYKACKTLEQVVSAHQMQKDGKQCIPAAL